MRSAICLFVALALPISVWAGDKKKPAEPPPTPEERAHSLVRLLRTSPNEDHRANAAEALAGFDAVRFFEIIPALMESLEKDSSPAVRRAAARALGDLKPRSAEALSALEQAADNDASWRVRQVARWAKIGYRVDEQKQTKEVRETKKSARSAERSAERSAPAQATPLVLPPAVKATGPSRTAPLPLPPAAADPVLRPSPLPAATAPPAYLPLELPPPPKSQAAREGEDRPILIAPGKQP